MAGKKREKPIGIFLIHGATKTNKELEAIKQQLEKNKQIKVCLPLLPGHGTCPYFNETCLKHFWKTTPEEWLNYSEKEFLNWKKDYKKIYIGGISLGGNISLCLAAKYEINGLILVGTPIFLSKVLSLAYGSSKIALWVINKVNKKYKRENKGGQFHGLPIARIMKLKKFIDESKSKLKLVNTPVLILHSKRDDMAHPKSANYIVKNIGSKHKKIIWLKTPHGIDINSKKQINFISNKIINFIGNL